MTAARGKVFWVSWVISVLASLMFFMSAAMKLAAPPPVQEGFAHLGIPASLMVPLAILEIACVVVYLIPATAVLGAVLVTGYLGGAICSHLRVGDALFMPILLGVLVWLALYLREPRLKDLLPLRR